jgi:hypothetical protein
METIELNRAYYERDTTQPPTNKTTDYRVIQTNKKISEPTDLHTIEVSATKPHIAPDSTRYTPEVIAPQRLTHVTKEPYAAFARMRKIGRINYNTYEPYYHDYRSASFVKQAEYMKDFADTYEPKKPLEAYYTTYDNMDDEQLRTYFSWRTKVRQGNVEDTSLSYAFCYIFELLNKIGVATAQDGMNKLITFWTEFRVHNTKIDSYLTKWARDYYVVNRLLDSFDSVANGFPVPYKTKVELFDKLNLGTWDINLVEMRSRHKITRMSFYKTGNQKVIEDCLNGVFIALNEFFKANGVNLVNLYVSVSPNGYYTPFQGAVYAHKKVGNLSVKLSDYETYNCINDKWSVHEYNYTNMPYTKGYILKTIEIEIRKALGGKRGLSPPKLDEISIELRDGRRAWNQVKEWRKKAYELLRSKEFEQTIASAVQTYCKTANIVVTDGTVLEIKPVEIDLSKLDKIREEHEATAMKLIVEEQLEEATILPPEPEQGAPLDEPEGLSGLTGFVDSLNNDETTLLIKVLETEHIPANCELLMESINDKALVATGDNIIGYIDGIPCVYEEYMDEIKTSLGVKI